MIESFVTACGVRVPAISAAQMCALNRPAERSTAPGGLEVMENAGRSLCSLVLETLGPDWIDAHVVVLAGGGDVAAGGLCAARHLANRRAGVTVVYADPEKLPGTANLQRRVYGGSGGREASRSGLTSWSADLIVDALATADLRSAPDREESGLIEWANSVRVPVVSLDVPAGIDATTGQRHDYHIRASKTLTLALPKSGLVPDRTGELLLADVGVPAAVFADFGLAYDPPFGHRYTVPLFVG